MAKKRSGAGGWNFLQTPWTWTPLLFAPKRRPNCARSSARGRKPLVIGQVGRMIPEKNHVFLLELARLLKEKGADCRFLLIGDGPLRASLAQKVALYGLGDRVIFTGLREDVDVLLQALDGFAMPSLMEGLPVALVEAQAAGFPAWFPTAFPKKPIWAFPWCSFCRRTTFIKRTGSKLYPTGKRRTQAFSGAGPRRFCTPGL